MQKKCDVISVLGETNAGKSTMINALVGQKVSIVSRKVQTTISNISGILTEGNTQIVLIDTPGFFKSKNALNYERKTWEAFRGSDLVIFVVDANKKNFNVSTGLLEKIDKQKKVILVLNKVDLVKKAKLLSIVQKFAQIRDFYEVFLISSTNNDGIDKLRNFLLNNAPEGDWMFDEEETTDQSTEDYVAEITREHLYDLVHQEIPYSAQVKTIAIEQRKNGGLKIFQEIIVQKETHKTMIIGHGATKIKAIGEASRKELQEIFGCPVQLFVTVKQES